IMQWQQQQQDIQRRQLMQQQQQQQQQQQNPQRFQLTSAIQPEKVRPTVSVLKKRETTFEQIMPDFLEVDNTQFKGKKRTDVLQQRLSALLAISAEQATTLRENIDQGMVVLVEQEEGAAQTFNRLIEQYPKKS
ncbi:unnamed protein product, partial [Sphagnum jensenii]